MLYTQFSKSTPIICPDEYSQRRPESLSVVPDSTIDDNGYQYSQRLDVLELRDLFGLFTERSPDLNGYGLPPPVPTTVPRDGNCTNSAHPAPVPRRLRRSGPFTSEGDTRELCDVYSRGVLITPRYPCRRVNFKRSEPEPSLLRDGPPLAGSKLHQPPT